jgi:zinc transport system permease protein
MFEIFQFEFIQNALIAGILASIVCGVIGTFVIVNRLGFITGGIAHASYGGIGIAHYFGIPYMLGITGFSVVISIVTASLITQKKHRADTFIGVLWAFGMALGVILIDITPGYNVDLMSYLFGSILAVSKTDIIYMSVLTIFILFCALYFYKDFLAISYDPEFAKLRGISVNMLNFLLIVLIAISVVILIKVAGLILVIALISIPPYISEKYSKSLIHMMIISGMLCFIFICIGLWLSYIFNLTSGASIIMVASVFFLLSLFSNHK